MRRSECCVATLACLLCAGCSRAPSVGIIGSFFPGWMICVTAGVIGAFLARFLLLRSRLETEVGPLALFYPCVVVLLTCVFWLMLFR